MSDRIDNRNSDYRREVDKQNQRRRSDRQHQSREADSPFQKVLDTKEKQKDRPLIRSQNSQDESESKVATEQAIRFFESSQEDSRGKKDSKNFSGHLTEKMAGKEKPEEKSKEKEVQKNKSSNSQDSESSAGKLTEKKVVQKQQEDQSSSRQDSHTSDDSSGGQRGSQGEGQGGQSQSDGSGQGQQGFGGGASYRDGKGSSGGQGSGSGSSSDFLSRQSNMLEKSEFEKVDLKSGAEFSLEKKMSLSTPTVQQKPVSLLDNKQLLDQIVQYCRLTIRNDEDQEMELQLNESMFRGLKMKVTQQSGRIRVSFLSGSASVVKLFESQKAGLQAHLAEKGIEVKSINVILT